MRNLLMILFMAGVLLIPSIAFTFQNEPDNFRGIKWGTNINELHDMQKITETDEMIVIYTRKGDKMKIGDANLNHIYYFFYKNQFYKIYIKISSESDFDKIKATLLNIYGEATRDELLIKDIWEYISEWIWDGNEVQVKLFYETFKDKFLSYIYKPIEFEVSKELKRKAKKRREKARERAKEGAKDL